MRSVLDKKPSSILYFDSIKYFWNFIENAIYKCSRFFKVFLKKYFEFILCERSKPILFNSSFILLEAKIDLF